MCLSMCVAGVIYCRKTILGETRNSSATCCKPGPCVLVPADHRPTCHPRPVFGFPGSEVGTEDAFGGSIPGHAHVNHSELLLEKLRISL